MSKAYKKGPGQVINEQKTKQKIDKILYVLLLGFYILASTYTSRTAGSSGSISFAGNEIPISAFSGVLSSISNVSLILMVVFLKKAGYVTAVALTLIQFPLIVFNIIRLNNMRILPGVFGNILALFVIVIIYRKNSKIEKYQKMELDNLKEQQKGARRLFEQTATALVSSIDAKDVYSKGHSKRVAEYSRKIAKELGKSEEDCVKIYYDALLHDVGMIGVDNTILTKKGKLSEDEYEIVKKHSEIGYQILTQITEYPFIGIGAHYHHERFDGTGYPDGLKGEDIPEVARIIAVADAYDAMTSNRSYRNAMPQQIAREEIVKGAGTQFDPNIARIMQHLIDIDSEFEMKEQEEKIEFKSDTYIMCDEYRSKVSEGILITPNITSIRFKVTYDKEITEKSMIPAMILFDSLDGKVHSEASDIELLNYFEYAEIWLDGKIVSTGARKMEVEMDDVDTSGKIGNIHSYSIETVRCGDHVLIKIFDDMKEIRVTAALPDSTRYAYIGLTGEHCLINDVRITRSEKKVDDNYIKRIAPKVSYIDRIEGDIPNVQIDGFRTASTKGIPIRNGMEIRFHTKSLPTSRLIWHCPYIVICNSREGNTDEPGYAEYALVRLDGEMWETDNDIKNDIFVEKNDDFPGWDAWKANNKKGFECTISFERRGGRIIMTTVNSGIYIKNITYLSAKDEAYVVLTGDQCALTYIRVME